MVEQEKSNCLCCGIEIDKHPREYNKRYDKYYVAKNKIKKFCSHTCAINIRKKKETRQCEYCNKDFSVISWEKKRFCNSYCAGKALQSCKKHESWKYRSLKESALITKKKKRKNKKLIDIHEKCLLCDNTFIKRGNKKYCSKTCSKNGMWKTSKVQHRLMRKARG
jgi:hypothetical protein